MPLVIENRALKIGIDPDRGGAICWLSAGGAPHNLLNTFDCGRFVQQSYYGADDGSDWNGKPWRWNPVQGGSWQNKPARVLECAQVEHNRLRTAVVPRNWGGQELCEDVVMRADITLQNDHIHLEHTFEYSGTAPHPPRIQELPAVFVARRLSQLVFYEGDTPWTGGALTVAEPGFPNEDFKMSEGWAAWQDPTTGEAVGVYVPWCTSMTAYRVGADGSGGACDCSYFAPTMRFAVAPGGFTYHAFIAIGSVDEIRRTFGAIRGWLLGNRPAWLACPIPGAVPALPGGRPRPHNAPAPSTCAADTCAAAVLPPQPAAVEGEQNCSMS